MYDYFVGQLLCASCGALSPPDSSTNMQTHLRSDADSSMLGLGFRFDPEDLAAESILSSGYRAVQPAGAGDRIRILNTWTCPSCRREGWATIRIEQGRIAALEATPLNRVNLEKVNYIDAAADYRAEALSGERYDAAARVTATVAVLRRYLE